MAHRSDDVEFVRSVGNPLVDDDASEKNIFPAINFGEDGGSGGGGSSNGDNAGDLLATDNNGDDDADLPQCKIKRNYSCNLCPFFSQNPRSFLYHSRDVHFDRIKIFECSQCLYASKHSQKLQRHINMIHVAGKNRIKRTTKLIKLDRRKDFRPIKPKPMESTPEAAEKPIKDAEGNEFDQPHLEKSAKPEKDEPENLAGGEDLVDGEFKCPLCNFTHKNLKFMRRHERIVHLKKRFLRCNKCSYVTHVKARYTKHVKYHSMPMIKCDLCDFRTPYKWNLDRHYKNHCGTGAFQCSKCNFRADIKQSLTVHEMNHHVPPVGQGAVMARKKNKVGASEALTQEPDANIKDEMDLLALERENGNSTINGEDFKYEKTDSITFQNIRNVKVPYTNKRESANNNNMQTDFIHPDDIVPRYGQIYVKNLKCKFCSYKAVFTHEIWRHEKRIHGYIRPESRKENIPKRPPPKLIPIQSKTNLASPVSSPILKIPAVKSKSVIPSPETSPSDKTVNENEFNEMCKKSCLTSSLKDFVFLIGDEEGLKTIPDSSRNDLDMDSWVSEVTDDQEPRDLNSIKQCPTELLKKKNASFFDKLKEKLITGNTEEQCLFCEICGHESKCLSEAVAHEKRHSDSNYKSETEGHQENEIVLTGAELSSTRCQHCRQRCKTSTDLINHLKSCKAYEATHEPQRSIDDLEQAIKSENLSCDDEENGWKKYDDNEGTMENRVFVWNDLSQGHEEEDEREAMGLGMHCNEEYQQEITSLYGAVTSKGSDNTESGTLVMEVDPRLNLIVKKVFKCPHCSFWASTASRFHVHIVGHLNKKPFECSLCLYRSNWRWDITKHIRLKSARDPSHLEAQVNMTDETGRRNYSKYNKYLTMMKVQELTAESSGTGRRSKPTEATQGNATENDIIPLPAPPRLTRAPTPGTPQQVPQGLPLRPPPPLKAAHSISSPAKVPLKCAREATKKTLWKCKKCNFRDSNKNNVLAHVKEHYGKKSDGTKEFKATNDEENVRGGNRTSQEGTPSREAVSIIKSLPKTPSYKCGHCQQVSNWKHVIQRHCRLKHNGNALIQIGWKERPTAPAGNSEENCENFEPAEDSIELISCDICPFTTDTEGDLTAHKLNHVDRPGSIFKCSYCPFYVPSKIAVLEHMEIHGVNDGCDLTFLKVDNFDPSEWNEDFSTPHGGNAGDLSKRYKCRQCPYLSNSRTQFLYHKQFHRPRDAPFKCMYCSYNVSRRHLLHQHLRVHHNQKERLKRDEQKQENSYVPSKDISTLDMAEIPLVWVMKAGNFHKMYKCRWCPHVNLRKINIQDHEKMHRGHENSSDANQKHCCSECNYTCSKAGVLASHVKVHQGFYGEIQCFFDPTKSETDQIRELENGSKLMESKRDGNNEVENNQGSKEKIEEEQLSSQPENAYNRSTNKNENFNENDESKKILSFCNKCPARFFFKKELRIHFKFHMIHLPFRCSYCSYTARQRPHLLAHYKVHTEEYQEKTANFVKAYAVSPESPQPHTVIITNGSKAIPGKVWAVVSPGSNAEKSRTRSHTKHHKPLPKHACHRCPAKFFKSVALQYHLTLHGGSHQHKCKYCDYTVKTYGNLIKHQLVHEDSTDKKHFKGLKFSYEFSISGQDLIHNPMTLQEQNDILENRLKCDETTRLRADPQFGTLMHGSPDFIYPTYYKNGKLKEKRYKCHKCPSAFEKREQYRIHLSLHGSRQKYKCEKCDYSVKYYANYVQHMRKHEIHDEAVQERNANSRKPDKFREQPLAIGDNSRKTLQDGDFTLIEQQTLLLQERRKPMDSTDESRHYDCKYCPFANNRKNAVETHMRRHYRISKTKHKFECPFCDYSTSHDNFLREHCKLHFEFRHKPEAYLKCEKLELWCSEEDSHGGRTSESNLLVFQDRGEEVENRFLPPLMMEFCDDNEIKWKIYVDANTGEPVEKVGSEALHSKKNRLETQANDDLIEVVKETCEIYRLSEKTTNIRTKRWRGKNWKCKRCPHAFGKRDQYVRHIALHGSNQKHNCDICDYSVKFYTNYVQHMRMHQNHEPNRVISVKKNCSSLDEAAADTNSEGRQHQKGNQFPNSFASH
ncbi:hypothetical protein RUM44_003315 [Polyplax serrata]|uniref:C2H2-type domain-containing protein n=1 Tax=Polyplax serrata TaxID=468196 RepID=A0ABR1AG81_POLSC